MDDGKCSSSFDASLKKAAISLGEAAALGDAGFLKNQFIYDLSIERKVTENWSVFAEVFGNSKATTGERGTFSGAIATEYEITKHFNVFVSVGYDTDHVFNVRPGFNVHF